MGDSTAPGATTAAVGLGTVGGGGGGGGGDGSSGWGHNGSAPWGGDGDVWVMGSSGAWLLAGVLSLIILTTACGNILLIGLVLTQRSLRCTSNCFLVSLFLSDLMVALVVMPPAMLNALCGAWVLRPGFCPVWLCFDVMCCSASILNLCVISLDRYLLIISPLRYKQHMTPPAPPPPGGRGLGLAALTSFLPIEMGWHSLSRGRGHAPGRAGSTAAWRSWAAVAAAAPAPRPRRSTRRPRNPEGGAEAGAAGGGARPPTAPLPLGREPSRPSAGPATGHAHPDRDGDYCSHQEPPAAQHPQSSVSSERRLEHRQGRRALKASLTLGVLLGLFFSAWLPFFITNMAQAVCECVPTALFDALTWLGYCNSTMNPIIYPLFMRDFKRALGRLLPCCCCSASSSSSSRSPRRPSPPLSLSLRNSGEPHVPSDPPSLSSDPPQPPATATDAVNLFDAEHAASRLPLLLPNQVDTLD
ncbi:hypothetical protein ANANG_G00227810 [Anguilla anguilla]|uniref:G-protein coupled receptors family 1 profile domain-containing protein n=1 Tax=Anguilla anguilla TaxID=7936 RepID=A0A9D3LXL3_ANGAN|nr:hypothetical protein ANANG_G00227810 [Anguilla anguilla]